MRKSFVILTLSAVVTALVLAGCQATRAGYESAPYKVVRTHDRFELREYPPLTVVETTLNSQGSDDGSFGRLFGFITGRNEAGQKISMTTPVFMSGDATHRTMAFVMPAKLQPNQIPRPTDGTLTLRTLPAGQFAVLRYRGKRNPVQETESLERLKSWMAKEGLSAMSPPVYGYFDPPWTPSFLRRNEVMLQTGARQ